MKISQLLLAAAAAAASSSLLSAQYRYTYQTSLITGPTVMTEGCLLVDVDADGDDDVVFANGFVLNSTGSAIQPTLLINKINQGLLAEGSSSADWEALLRGYAGAAA